MNVKLIVLFAVGSFFLLPRTDGNILQCKNVEKHLHLLHKTDKLSQIVFNKYSFFENGCFHTEVSGNFIFRSTAPTVVTFG